MRPAEVVAPELIGCHLFRRTECNQILSGVIVETEAYSQNEPACHGYNKRSPKNETLFGEPGRLYIYLTYGIYYCVNIVTDRKDWANGVLLRAIALPSEHERIASGPGLLAKKFNLTSRHDSLPLSIENGIWITNKSTNTYTHKIVSTTRVGINKAKYLPWRWYLQASRSVSKRAKNDRLPSIEKAWIPSMDNLL